MTNTLIILGILLWGVSLALLQWRQMLAPAASYLALLLLSFADGETGLPLLPINNVILVGWLAMTLIVMVATILQPEALQAQKRGVGYLTVGAVAGMSVGLLGFSVTDDESMLYSLMIVATAIGSFFGFILFTNTPDGKDVSIRSGRFFRYLLAKGFPVIITVMMMGVAALLAITVLYNS